MLPQIALILLIVAWFCLWVRSTRGKAARALVWRAKAVLLVPPVLWALVWLLSTADLGPLDRPFLRGPGGLSVSATTILLIAIHVTASVLVLAALGRAAGWSVTARRILPGILLGQSALWLAMLGLLHLHELAEWRNPGIVVFLAAMGIPLVLLNLLLARLVARLLANGGGLRDSLAGLLRADRAREAPLLATVLLRLLVTGAVVVIWISGHVTVRRSETPTRVSTSRTTISATSANIDVQTVATVTCSNPWLRKVEDAIKEAPSEVLRRALDLATAFAALLFLGAFASARAPSALVPTPQPG